MVFCYGSASRQIHCLRVLWANSLALKYHPCFCLSWLELVSVLVPRSISYHIPINIGFYILSHCLMANLNWHAEVMFFKDRSNVIKKKIQNTLSCRFLLLLFLTIWAPDEMFQKDLLPIPSYKYSLIPRVHWASEERYQPNLWSKHQLRHFSLKLGIGLFSPQKKKFTSCSTGCLYSGSHFRAHAFPQFMRTLPSSVFFQVTAWSRNRELCFVSS